MANPTNPESKPTPTPENDESFADILAQFEHEHTHKPAQGTPQIEGTVVALTEENVVLDIGYKTEGVLPRAAFQNANEEVKVGDKLLVSIKGRAEGYYQLSRSKVAVPTDWSALEKAFNEKAAILGTVTAVVKGGLSVDVGVRAFLPASRSGARDAAALEKLIGTQLRCRIIKLDVADENVVVDHRIVVEEEEKAVREKRFAELVEDATLSGTVRTLADYGAFVDLGGVDALLHISDMSWSHLGKPADLLHEGQQVQVKVLKIDREKRKISVGLKQLEPQPWDAVADKYKVGEKISGTVTRLAEFGAFVELEPGIEGLIHLSEMSWSRKIHKPSDVVQAGERVEAVILAVHAGEHRISLGLKQTLGDPWTEASRKFAPGTIVEGPVTNILKFGAFVELADGIEGMVHVSEILADRRVEHPSDVLKVGQVVKAMVLALDLEKHQIKLSMKQLIPTGLDEYIAEHKVGDNVTGRLLDDQCTRVELGEGIQAKCRATQPAAAASTTTKSAEKVDLGALTAMLNARWKGDAPNPAHQTQEAQAGQVRSFRIVALDAKAKTIELELA